MLLTELLVIVWLFLVLPQSISGYRIEVYFMSHTCSRLQTHHVDRVLLGHNAGAGLRFGTASVADPWRKTCPMLSMIFPQPCRASPIPTSGFVGKIGCAPSPQLNENRTEACPFGRSKAANQLQLLEQFSTKNRSPLPAGVAVNLSDNFSPNLQPSAAQKDAVDSEDCWKFHF